MKLPSPGFLLQAFIQVLRRFPATMFSAVLGVVSICILIEDSRDADEWAKTAMVSLLGLPFLTGLVAWSESKGWDDHRKWLVQLAGIALMSVYWFLIDPSKTGFEYRELPGYVVLVLVAHLFVSVAPYLNRRPVRDFWEFNKDLFANLIIGLAFTFILYAGISLAILAIDELFNLDLRSPEKIYLRLFFVMTGIFNTSYFLFHFPSNYAYESSAAGYNAIFRNLCKYILIPIVALYFIILYAYAFKILGTWELPRGWVASLVIGFSVAGIFTYLLNFYLPEQDASRQVHLFRRLFWWVVLPLTVLLFIAISRRISDYGVTEERYLVAQMGVWLALNCLYFLVSKQDNIKFIPVSMALFALSWAFGPFSAKAVAERSQVARLTTMFENAGRLQNGKLVQGKNPVGSDEIAQFESAVEFLERRNRLGVLNDLLPMPVDSLPESPGFYGNSGKLRAWLGLGETSKEAEDKKIVNVYTNAEFRGADIRGFASFQPINIYLGADHPSGEKDNYFSLSKDGKFLEHVVEKGGQSSVTERYDLQPAIRKWFRLRSKADSYCELTGSDRILDFTGKKETIRLIIDNAAADEDDKGCKLQSMSGFLFVK